MRGLFMTVVFGGLASLGFAAEPAYRDELIFPLHPQHNHAPGIVECPNGDLLASWYRGAGERSADDVAVFGAWLKKGDSQWGDAFVMADTPGFPDCNTCMMVDREKRIWLIWPVIIANTWESCITHYKVSSDYAAPNCPKWMCEGEILLKPVDFLGEFDRALEAEKNARPGVALGEALFVGALRPKAKDKMYQRLGWQPRCKPVILPSGRILLPLYSDTFSASIMAISDDGGKTWRASQALIGFGNIQPTILRAKSGRLVAYMRENGPRDHIRVSQSKDDGETWSPVETATLENPGAGVDGVTLANGHWLLVYNDTSKGRSTLAVSISDDEGKTWKWTRHLERHDQGAYHYPCVIQGADGTIHSVYSYFVEGGKSMKHAAFNEAWVQAGDPKDK